MIKESTTIKTITEKHRFCDICEHPAKTQCCKCGKDLCNSCVDHEDDTMGDYRGDCYCKTCWEIGGPFRELIASHEEKIYALYDVWDAKCKKACAEVK